MASVAQPDRRLIDRRHAVGVAADHVLVQVGAAAWVLSSATLLRPSGIPAGPAELLMLLVVGWRAITPAEHTASPALGMFRLLAALLAVLCAASTVAGAWAAFDTLPEAGPLEIRTTMSIVFALAFAESLATLAERSDAWPRLATSVLGWGLAIGVAIAAMALAGPGPLRALVLYPDADRIRGLAENPNQFALVQLTAIACLPFVLEHTHPRRRGAWIADAALTAAASLMSGSDAFMIALACATLAYLGLRSAGDPARLVGPVIVAAALGLVALAALLLAPVLGDAIGERIAAIYTEGDQGADRLALWTSALARFATDPWFGGGLSPQASLAKLEGRVEAHNTAIDWLSMTGAVGALLLFSVAAFAAACASAPARRAFALPPLVALFVFAMLHFVMRQPAVWCLIALAACAPARAGAPRDTGSETRARLASERP